MQKILTVILLGVICSSAQIFAAKYQALNTEEHYPNGQLKSRMVVDENGDGLAEGYFENGALEGRSIVRDMRVVDAKIYRRDGSLDMTMGGSSAVPVEIIKHYDNKSHPSDSISNGAMDIYHTNGKLKSRFTNLYHAVYDEEGLLKGCEGECKYVPQKM